MNEVNITKDEFESYEAVRESGMINMFFISKVSELTEIPKDRLIYLMEHYEELDDKFGEKND